MANPFDMDTTNFDEVLPEPVQVTMISFEEYEAAGPGKEKVLRRRPVKRIAEINTYVPMRIFHKMMSSQEKLRAIQAKRLGPDSTLNSEEQQVMLDWMVGQVLAVWKLTEPEMDEEKLTEGLSFQKVIGLFGLFFGDLLKNQEGAAPDSL